MSAAIFGQVSTIMLRMYQGTTELHEMSLAVKEFIKFHNISPGLSQRMTESFDHQWGSTNGIDMNSVRQKLGKTNNGGINH